MTSLSTRRVRRYGSLGLLFRREPLAWTPRWSAKYERQLRESRNAPWQLSTAMRGIHAASLRYCRRQLLFLATHVPWPVPRNNLSLQNDIYGALGSAYLRLSIHGLSCLPLWITALLSLLHFL